MFEDNFKELVAYDESSPLNIKNLYFCPFLKGLKSNEKVLQWFQDKTTHLIADENIRTKLINLVKRYVMSLFGVYKESLHSHSPKQVFKVLLCPKHLFFLYTFICI